MVNDSQEKTNGEERRQRLFEELALSVSLCLGLLILT